VPNDCDEAGAPAASYARRVDLDAVRDAIVGAWRLVTYEDREDAAAPWTAPFGRRPRGLAVYEPGGDLTVQVFGDPSSAADVGVLAYTGSFSVREARRDGDAFVGVVDHRLTAASDPAFLEEDSARPFRVSGSSLVLGDEVTWRRSFARMPFPADAARERLGSSALVSAAGDEGWAPDPDVGGEMNTLYRTGSVEAGLSRFREATDPVRWTLPARETFYVIEGAARIEIDGADAIEVSAGEMATIPAGAVTTWHLTTPFLDFYVLT